MKVVLCSSPANRISAKNQILTVGLIAAIALVVTQTTLVSEVDAAKELETTCVIQENYDPDDVDIEQRLCCTYEVDTETGERETLECWVEYCHIPTEICSTTPEAPSGLPPAGMTDRLVGEQEILPTPPSTTPEGIIDRTPGQGEVLQTPPATTQDDVGITKGTITDRLPFGEQEVPPPPETMQEDTSITDRPIDEGEVLPTPPSIVKQQRHYSNNHDY